jgi:ribonuclease R
MLPEELSADLCSLKEDVDRACLAVRMKFDKRTQTPSRIHSRDHAVGGTP